MLYWPASSRYGIAPSKRALRCQCRAPRGSSCRQLECRRNNCNSFWRHSRAACRRLTMNSPQYKRICGEWVISLRIVLGMWLPPLAATSGAVDQEGNRVLGAAPGAVADPWTQPDLDPWGQAGAAATDAATWAGAAAWSQPTAPDTAVLAVTAGANAWDSGTDTDASDDDGTETLDDQDLRGLEHLCAQEQAFWAYRTAKRRWRRYRPGLQGPLAGILGSAPAPANTFLVTEAATATGATR